MCAARGWCRLSVARSAGGASVARTAMLTLAGLDLEQPDGDVDGDAQRPAGPLERVGGELAQRDAAAGSDLWVDAAAVSRSGCSDGTHTHPLMPIARPWQCVQALVLVTGAARVPAPGAVCTIVAVATAGARHSQGRCGCCAVGTPAQQHSSPAHPRTRIPRPHHGAATRERCQLVARPARRLVWRRRRAQPPAPRRELAHQAHPQARHGRRPALAHQADAAEHPAHRRPQPVAHQGHGPGRAGQRQRECRVAHRRPRHPRQPRHPHQDDHDPPQGPARIVARQAPRAAEEIRRPAKTQRNARAEEDCVHAAPCECWRHQRSRRGHGRNAQEEEGPSAQDPAACRGRHLGPGSPVERGRSCKCKCKCSPCRDRCNAREAKRPPAEKHPAAGSARPRLAD
jgi:hypothetical protein